MYLYYHMFQLKPCPDYLLYYKPSVRFTANLHVLRGGYAAAPGGSGLTAVSPGLGFSI